MSRWLYFPAPAASAIYTFADTMDSSTFGSGSKCTNPSVTPTFSYFSSSSFVGIRANSLPAIGVAFHFPSTANRSSFISDYPAGTLDITFTWTSGARSGSTATASGATYTTARRLRFWVTYDQFTGGDGWAAIAPNGLGGSLGFTGVNDDFELVLA